MAASTVANKLSSLRQFFAFLKDHGLIPHNPCAGVKSPKVSNETTRAVLTQQEAVTLLHSIDTGTIRGKRDKAILALMLVNGLREAEISKANVGDILKINEYDVLRVSGKGGKVGEAKLRADVLAVMSDYIAARGQPGPDEAIFVGHNHTAKSRIRTASIRLMVDKRLRALKLKRPGMSTHSLRHTAITVSILNGATLIQAQALARHGDPKVTMRYFHNLDRLKSNAVDLNPICVSS